MPWIIPCNVSRSPCIQNWAGCFGSILTGVMRLRKFGALVLLVASSLSPASACTVADMPMTGEERACCQMMKGQCGEKGMPASQGCCHKIPGSVYDNALNKKAVALHPVAVPVVWLPAHGLGIPTSSIRSWVEHRDGSIRKHPPSTVSVLRI